MNLKDRIKTLQESPVVAAALNTIADPVQRLEAETAIKKMIAEALDAFGPIGHFDVPEVPSHKSVSYINKENNSQVVTEPDAK